METTKRGQTQDVSCDVLCLTPLRSLRLGLYKCLTLPSSVALLRYLQDRFSCKILPFFDTFLCALYVIFSGCLSFLPFWGSINGSCSYISFLSKKGEGVIWTMPINMHLCAKRVFFFLTCGLHEMYEASMTFLRQSIRWNCIGVISSGNLRGVSSYGAGCCCQGDQRPSRLIWYDGAKFNFSTRAGISYFLWLLLKEM